MIRTSGNRILLGTNEKRLSERSGSNPEIMERSARWPRVHASGVARLLPYQAPSPFRSEQVPPLGIFFVEVIGVDDTVGSEAAKILAQLAPGRQQAHGFEIANGDRPDGAFAVTTVFVAIAQRDFPALVDLRACPHHVDAVGFPAPARAGAAGGFK